ncbi:cyclase family protein [Orientia tsutsugamushi str. UT144]|uniref:Cyclase family protein n=1 Tax=Orientia tsutsugamushi str. UT144 TaxID=1441384 RepID=A0A0F3RN27_ORITS|nr:cyclase family protein [Orientia tsutsugamushi]KJW07421.1 cyclase family protein [Orientia tsutsugamushi str. UT144]
MTFLYKLIDLTHALDSTISTWNGGCGFNHDVHIDYADCYGEDKFRVMKVKMHAGIGTHMDAPSHCIAQGRFIHDFDVNDLIMPYVVLDVSDQCHERYSLSAQDVTDFESKYGLIQKDSCVMVKTGWSKFWHTPNYIFPSVSSEAAELLLERGVSAISIDTLSPDRTEDGFKVHKTFLSADKIIVENVANLDSIPPTGSFVMIMPIKIKDGTEALVRLVGLIERDGANE